MKKYALALLAVATAIAIVPMASADPITGTLNSNNGINFTVSGPGGVAFTNPAIISASTGNFVPFIGDDVTMGNIPAVDSGNILLISGYGGDAAQVDGLQYEVTSYTYTDNGGDITVNGIGTMSLDGYDPTLYSFSLTAQGGNDGSFSLTAMTPEPSSLLLLGTGFLGLALLSFRRAKAAPRMIAGV